MPKHVLLSAYDDWFLRPLDLLSMLLAAVYLYHRAWLLGSFLLLFGSLLGIVGQALNRDKTFRQLAHKRHWLTIAEFNAGMPQTLAGRDAFDFGKAITGTWAALAVAATLIALHGGFRGYIAVSIGLLFGFMCQAIFFLIVAFMAFGSAKTRKLAEPQDATQERTTPARSDKQVAPSAPSVAGVPTAPTGAREPTKEELLARLAEMDRDYAAIINTESDVTSESGVSDEDIPF
jgi:hypothetical protein